MIKVIIEIEEKETLKFKGIEAKNVCCSIKSIYRQATKAENESANELIKRVTNNHKELDIIDKTVTHKSDVEKILDIISKL